ncbi:MAG: hypothetical protein ACQEUN_16560 [Pseudomonadota bacterium]
MRQFDIILHIGTEKTGTKTLQHTLLENQPALMASGVHYFTSPGRIEARTLAAAALGDEEPDDYLQQQAIHGAQARQAFREEVKRDTQERLLALPEGVHTVVISSEHFHSRLRRPAHVRRLHALLAPMARSFRVVCYLRRQVDLLASYYSTVLKNGGTRELEEVARAVCRPGNAYYDYAGLLARWADEFGEGAICARRFDPAEWYGGSLVQDFLTCSGLGELAPSLSAAPVHNESLTPEGQALLVALNRRAAAMTLQEADRVAWQRVRVRVSRACAGRGRLLPRDLAVKHQAAFDEGNAEVCRRWFANRGSLFAPLAADYGMDQAESGRLRMVNSLLEELVESDEPLTAKAMLDGFVNQLRDTAVAMEADDLCLAHGLMEKAHRLRPEGPFISRKLDDYRRRIEAM